MLDYLYTHPYQDRVQDRISESYGRTQSFPDFLANVASICSRRPRSRRQTAHAERVRRAGSDDVRVRFHIIRNACTENVGKSQYCMVSKLRIIWKQTVVEKRTTGVRVEFTKIGRLLIVETRLHLIGLRPPPSVIWKPCTTEIYLHFRCAYLPAGRETGTPPGMATTPTRRR